MARLRKPQPEPAVVPAGGAEPSAPAAATQAGGVPATAPRAPGGQARKPADTPVLELDFAALRAKGYLTPESTTSVEAEEYRRLKRPVLANAFGKGPVPVERGNLIAVTSSIEGEGKTFTTINLALSISLERDTTVLMVDSDLIRRSLSRILGLDARLGLTDVLMQPRIDLSEVIVPTNFPNLRVLPAGSPHDQATELLASERMHQIADELSRRYEDRVVLFDAPPILASSQAGTLVDHVGQVLVVVEAGRTPQRAVADAVALLPEDKVVGMVLNKSRRQLAGGYYGGYYGSYGD